MTLERLNALLDAIRGARVALIGDVCLDLYWKADMRLSELSRETPHYPLPVVEERFSPGGAGNVAANLAALRPKSLAVVGLTGDDWRADLLETALHNAGVDGARLVRSADAVTNTYIKPLRAGISDVVYEDPRIDFENRAPISPDVEARILDALHDAAADADVLLVSDQMQYGCVTDAVRAAIVALGEAGKTVVVDSRSRIAAYRGVIVKPNEVEASRAFGDGGVPGEDGMAALAAAASRRTGRDAVVTAGGLGCFVAEGGGVRRVPGARVDDPIDIVGAGDTFLSALGAALAAGAALSEAAALANLASSVTIRKIGTTGTASPEEIRAAL